MAFDRIVKAAQQRMGGESTGAWKLAEALAADIPAQAKGGDRKSESANQGSDVAALLREAADRLLEEGVETPAGEPYTPASLKDLRMVAVAWSPEDRFEEAAFRTHQEAGKDERKRQVLAVLCEAARTGDLGLPELEDGEIDEIAWMKATASIARKRERGSRYPVSANDFRIALKRKKNTPARDATDPGEATAIDAIEAMQDGNDKFDYAVRVLAKSGTPTTDVRDAIEGLLNRLQATLDFLTAYLNEGGITDASLSELLAEEQR
jgi:hypothetical protein